MKMLAWMLALVFLLAPLALAYEEEEAPRVRLLERGVDDVERVWHEPELVEPGTQWEGFIRFRDGHRIMEVQYQICDVGRVCFAPPVAAQRVDNNTWTFNTTDYRDPVSEKPIEYQAGWRIGTQYILTEQLPNGTLETHKFPKGIEKPEDLEYHYFAFDMPPAQDRSTPAPGIGLVVACLVLAARRRQ